MDKERNNKEVPPDNKLTIVGGQPSEKKPQLFNTNIEKLLLKATSDEEFREKLLNNRKEVLEDEEHSLTSQDKMLLSSIPPEKLKDMIEKFKLQKNPKKKILKGSAITMALLTCSYIDMVQSFRTNTLGIRSDDIIDHTYVLSTLSKPVLTLYISTILFKVKQNFWKILGTAFLIFILFAITHTISSFLLYDVFGYKYFQATYLSYTINIILLIIFSTPTIKFILNIRWLLAIGISITNSIFLVFLMRPYNIFEGILFLLSNLSLSSAIWIWRIFDIIEAKTFLGFMLGVILILVILIYWGCWKKSDNVVIEKEIKPGEREKK